MTRAGKQWAWSGVGAAAIGFLLASASGEAQTIPSPDAMFPTSAAVEEVVVTARQRSESLKDVPAPISVLTGATLRAAGISRVEGVIALTPGVSIVNGAAEQGDTQVNIRGVNSARDAQPSFAFVLDGIQISDPAAFNREYADLAQIEVVKGPQGAVYGRNAEAGAIIVTTEKPTDHFSGSLDTSLGTYGLYTVKGLVSGPLNNNIKASLSADFRNNDGEFKNSLFTAQHALDYLQGGNINGRLIYTPDSSTTVDVKARYGRLEAGSINFNSVFELPSFASALGVAKFYEDPNRHSYVYQNDVPNDNRQEAGEISAKLDHDFSWARLTAWGLYSHIRNDLLADGTSASFGFFNAAPSCVASVASLSAQGVTLPSPTFLASTPSASLFGAYTPTTCDGYQYQRRVEQDESGEIRLTSPSGRRFRWLAGAYYLHSERQVGVATGLDQAGAPPRQLFVAAGPYATEQLLDDGFTSDVGAVFGQAQYDILPAVEGSFALRYDSEDRHVHNEVPPLARTQYIDYDGPPYTGGAPLNPGLDPLLNPSGVHDRDKTYSQIQPKAGLRWTYSPEITAYADWGVGFKSGGFNNLGSQATINTFINPLRIAADYASVNINDDYKKETSSEFELGSKGRFLDGRLTVDASVFDNTVRNSQFFEFFVGPFGLLRVVSNIDRVKFDGAELGLQYRADRYLTLDLSGAYTYSRIEKNEVRSDTVGNKSPYTPDYTWNLGLQYDRPVIDDLRFHSRVDVRGTGPTWFSDVQRQKEPTVFDASFGALGIADYSKTQRPAYVTVDLRIGVSKDGWTLTTFADNLFDERYLNEIIPAPEFGGVFGSPAEGARYGVEAAYRF